MACKNCDSVQMRALPHARVMVSDLSDFPGSSRRCASSRVFKTAESTDFRRHAVLIYRDLLTFFNRAFYRLLYK